jgi:predicted transposase
MSKRTIRCKMAPTSPMIEALDHTCETFTSACNHILSVAVTKNVSNNVKLHRLVYAQIRADYRLSANLVVRAIRGSVLPYMRPNVGSGRRSNFARRPSTTMPASLTTGNAMKWCP